MDDIEDLAHAAWTSGHLRTAFQHFREGASRGLEGCMLNAGYFHDEGIGTTTSKSAAMYWYKRACRAGYSCGATNVAILFRERESYRLMFRWFQISRARGDGDGDAELALARCYAAGQGVRRSRSLAMACLRRAIKSQHITPAGRDEARALVRKMRALPASTEFRQQALSHLERRARQSQRSLPCQDVSPRTPWERLILPSH